MPLPWASLSYNRFHRYDLPLYRYSQVFLLPLLLLRNGRRLRVFEMHPVLFPAECEVLASADVCIVCKFSCNVCVCVQYALHFLSLTYGKYLFCQCLIFLFAQVFFPQNDPCCFCFGNLFNPNKEILFTKTTVCNT